MKISDKELREAAGRAKCDYAFTSVELEKAAASELLQLRREVRRLRAALRKALAICDSPTGGWCALGEVLDAALKPQRGAK